MPRPIRIITPHYDDDDDNDPMEPPSASFLKPTPPAPRNLPREPRPSRPGRLRRQERTQSQPAQPIYGIPSPATVARGAADLEPPVSSPPFRDELSPEPGLIPGGGVQIAPGFRFNENDQGHYRTRTRDLEEGEVGEPRVLGGIGLGMFRGLKKIPAAIVKAGRSYGPRHQNRQDLSPLSEGEPVQLPREVLNQDFRDEVETYQEEEEEEPPAHEEQLLREYVQRRRMRRDRAYHHHNRRERDRNYVPAPQPVLVPGSRTPVPSAAASHVGHSQASHSQAGHSDLPSPTLEARLEIEELEQEREALAQAQERERARHLYAADAVKQPTSSTSFSPRFLGPESSSHRRSASEPGLTNHVFSRWAGERDVAGLRIPNRGDQAAGTASTSPLSMSNFRRIIQQIRDMPWVGDRVAADYIPGGVKPSPSSPRYYTSPGSDSTFTSLNMRGAVNGLRIPVSDVSAPPMARMGNDPSQSWYAQQDNMLVLPLGVPPPPGFIPYPGPHPPHQRDQGSEYGDGPPSGSSHTHVEGSAAPSMPEPAVTSQGPGPAYVNSGAYHYMPAAASATGQPYVFVPTREGRHRPLYVPEAGGQPGMRPGQPNFMPAA
jgi:hypothetical protein